MSAAISYPAYADLFTWQLQNVSFVDGGQVTGWFSVDTSTHTFLSWNISVQGGNTSIFPAATYDAYTSTLTSNTYTLPLLAEFYLNFMMINVDPTYGRDRQLRLAFGDLPDAGGTVSINATNAFAGECYSCGPVRLFAGGGTIFSTAFLDLSGFNQTIGSLSGSATVTNNGTASPATLTAGGDNTSTTFSGVIQDGTSSTGLTKTGTGALTITAANTYTGATNINGGVLEIASGGNITQSASLSNAAGATFQIDQGGASTFTGAVNNSGAISIASGGILNADGGIANNVGATIINYGTVTDDLNNAGTVANNGTYNALVATNTGTITNSGTWTGNVLSNTGTINNNNVWTGTVTNAGTFNNNIGATVSGLLTNSGIVNNAGTLSDGLTNTAGMFNNSGIVSGTVTIIGGILTGSGSFGTTTVASGAMFAPGNGTAGSSSTSNGSLALQSGAMYLVMLGPMTASFANVTGTATLGGATVNAIYASGGYISKQYTILTAGSISGTFGSLANTNLPANVSTNLSYDATHAYLNLKLDFSAPTGLNGNQQYVGNALTNFFNSTGSIPIAFATLSPASLTQASGETATGSQQTTFQAMTQFMGVMTDPFIDGRGGGASPSTGATGYADEGNQASSYAPTKRADAYAMFTKAPLAKTWDPHWSVWAAGFGGSQTTDGNAAAGSNSATSRVFGTAVGADYLLSPRTIMGFALAGGATSFSVANGGSGRSDLFQAGAFVRHTVGQAYITGALAYGWQDITTDRIVSIAGIDHLRAEFNANAFSGRLEGGYRFVMPWVGGLGITPYAAAQFTTFDLPAYAESVVSGANTFALAYNAKSVTDTRSEFGLRTDRSFAMPDSILTLRGRVAWAHDFDPDRSIAATFQALPGASFTVNGAAQASDSALTTASVERKWLNGFSLAATFEGEFSNVTSSYAGKGVARYVW